MELYNLVALIPEGIAPVDSSIGGNENRGCKNAVQPRTLLVTIVVVSAICGWFGMRYMNSQKAKQRAALLTDLEYNVSATHRLSRIDSLSELYARYPPDRLFQLAETYATKASQDAADSDSARIARAALVHLAADPRAVDLANQYFDQNIEPLSSAAIMILARHHRLHDDLHCSQFCESSFKDGDVNNPIAVYVLVTEIYSNFLHGDAGDNVLENWPEPEHPWQWRLTDAAKHSYQDKVKALQEISPESATAYASIIDIVDDCGANPIDEQYAKIHELSAVAIESLTSEKIFLYMLKHLDEFQSQPQLFFDPE